MRQPPKKLKLGEAQNSGLWLTFTKAENIVHLNTASKQKRTCANKEASRSPSRVYPNRLKDTKSYSSYCIFSNKR